MQYLLLIACLISIAGCSGKPSVVKQTDISVSDSENVYIVNHGWHTGFVVPAHTIQSRLPELVTRFANTPFLEFGWGDRGFYESKEITSSLTLQAILWPSESVVHVVALSAEPDLLYDDSEMVTLCLKSSQYALLIGFLENSFKKNNGSIMSYKRGIYGDSQFYKGEGDYHLLNTCNKWTAKGLKSAGANIRPTFMLTADSIMTFLSENNGGLPIGLCEAHPNYPPI